MTIPLLGDAAPTILIVDDVDTNRRMLEILLRSEGYEVISAETGEQALSEIEHQPPDLLLLDLALPDMHGSQLLAQVQRKGFTFPVLVVTGDSSPVARSTALHASEYLTKPYDVDALIVAVERLIRSPRSSTAPDG
jgi:DNA-binding response OmpR family regulator